LYRTLNAALLTGSLVAIRKAFAVILWPLLFPWETVIANRGRALGDEFVRRRASSGLEQSFEGNDGDVIVLAEGLPGMRNRLSRLHDDGDAVT
jgi:hypothetical protein